MEPHGDGSLWWALNSPPCPRAPGAGEKWTRGQQLAHSLFLGHWDQQCPCMLGPSYVTSEGLQRCLSCFKSFNDSRRSIPLFLASLSSLTETRGNVSKNNPRLNISAQEHGHPHQRWYFCTFISLYHHFPSSLERLEGGVHLAFLIKQEEHGHGEASLQLSSVPFCVKA